MMPWTAADQASLMWTHYYLANKTINHQLSPCKCLCWTIILKASPSQTNSFCVSHKISYLYFSHSRNITATKSTSALCCLGSAFSFNLVVVQSLSLVQLFVTPCTAACQASLPFTLSQSLLKLMSSELMMPSDHFILCHRLLLLPSISPSIRVFSNELALHITSPKYWSFSFSISPSNEYLGLISLRIDWFDFLAAQGTLKSLLQHHNLIASILQCSAFFIVQLSHLYLTTGKSTALTIQTNLF